MHMEERRRKEEREMEDKRRKEEREAEEWRRREDREHQIRMMSMLLQLQNPANREILHLAHTRRRDRTEMNCAVGSLGVRGFATSSRRSRTVSSEIQTSNTWPYKRQPPLSTLYT